MKRREKQREGGKERLDNLGVGGISGPLTTMEKYSEKSIFSPFETLDTNWKKANASSSYKGSFAC